MQCSKTQTKQYFKKQRGSDVEGEWKMAIVYRNMEKIVDLKSAVGDVVFC